MQGGDLATEPGQATQGCGRDSLIFILRSAGSYGAVIGAQETGL